MAGTTMADAKASLKRMLMERPSLQGVTIKYGFPGDTAKSEMIWMAGTNVDGTQNIETMRAGKKRRNEEYVLNLYIDSAKRKPEDSEKRACAISAEIEDALASDPTIMDTPNVMWAVVSGMEMDTTETTTGAGTRLRIEVTVRGNLQ